MPSIAAILGFVYRKKWDVLCVLAAVTLAGEVYLRLPCGRQLEYQPDPDLGGVFRPSQSSGAVTVNRDGHRGKDTDWTRPVILAVGDSQSWGSGVADDEVWTARLEDLLREKSGLKDVQVVNASHPGHGPYQQLVRIRRVLESHRAQVILVRVSIEDRRFTAPRPEDLPRLVAEAEWRQKVRSITKVLPFLANKAGEQLPSITAIFGSKAPQPSAARSAEAGRRMWKEQYAWWSRMVDRAEETRTPLVFYVHDPTDLPSSAALMTNLKQLIDGRKYVYLFRLGPAAYDLEPGTTDDLWRQYRSRLTLGHDPHGNKDQHALVARAIHAFLREQGILHSAGQPSYQPQ